MTSPASDTSSTPRQAILLATQPSVALTALGAAFDDLVVGSIDDVRQALDGVGPDTTVVVAGPVPESAVRAVVGHIVTVPGSRLALSVTPDPGSVGADELEGLRILGDGCLGDLPVTWWAASDAPADLAPLTVPGPGGIGKEGAETGFAAHAQLLRAQRGLAAPPAGRDVRQNPPAATIEPSPLLNLQTPGDVIEDRPAVAQPGSRAVLLAYRLPLALLLLAAGAALGVLAAQLADGDGVVWSVILVVLAATGLALAWVVRALRTLTAEVREMNARGRRLEGKLDRNLARQGRRVEAGAQRATRLTARIREVESRLAVVSTAGVNRDGARARAVRDSDQKSDPTTPAG